MQYQQTHLNGHVERYRYDSVHHDGIREKHKQGYDHRTPGGVGRHQRVPWKVHLEVAPHQPLPNAASHSAEHAHRQQEEYYLRNKSLC